MGIFVASLVGSFVDMGCGGMQGLSPPASVLQPWSEGLPHVDDLCYQLLTAAAGTLAYARENQADIAVLVIHEFLTARTDDAKHARNDMAYRDFTSRLSGVCRYDTNMVGILGPFLVPGLPLFSRVPPLLIGKAITDCREGNAVGRRTGV